jgi:hypothetical protein
LAIAITGIAGCWARATSGKVAVPPRIVTNFAPFQLIELHPLPLASVTA